jgi:hypothetical protein
LVDLVQEELVGAEARERRKSNKPIPMNDVLADFENTAGEPTSARLNQ